MSKNLHTLTKSELIERLAAEQKTAQSHLEQVADLQKRLATKEQTERWLNQKIAQLQRMIFGQKRERFEGDPDQGRLPFEASAEQHQQEETRHEEDITYVRNKPSKSSHKGRLSLPDHLPVEEIEIYPEGDLSQMVCIGKEVTEELE
jgi:transposase